MVKYGKRRSLKTKRKPWRKTKKFTKKRYSLASIPRRLPLNGLPQSYCCRHNFIQKRSINPDVSTFAVAEYRANDLFDPDVAVGGAQPMGFDQMMSYYNHFTVIGSVITVCPLVKSGTPVSYPSLWGIMLTDAPGAAASMYTAGGVEQILENRYCNGRYRVAGLDGSDSNQMKNRTLACKFSTKKHFKLKSIIGNKDLMGNVAASPAEQAIYALWMTPVTGIDDASECTFLVKIQYTVVYTEPKSLSRS